MTDPAFKLTIVTADTGKEEDLKRLCEVARTVSATAWVGLAWFNEWEALLDTRTQPLIHIYMHLPHPSTTQMDPPVKAVFHVAGISIDKMLYECTDESFAEVGDCKCKGAWWLHEVGYFSLFLVCGGRDR